MCSKFYLLFFLEIPPIILFLNLAYDSPLVSVAFVTKILQDAVILLH